MSILVLGLLCGLLMMAPISPDEVGPSREVILAPDEGSPALAITLAPDEDSPAENPVSVQDVGLANFTDVLNDAEKEMAARHPLQAVQVYLAASKAEQMTVQLYGNNGYQDDADAFRHCLWNALMKKSIGEDAAREWANAHEFTSEGIDREMDLFNNEVGRDISVEEMTEDQIVNTVRNLVSSGKCLRIVDGHCEHT
ncbi:MAG: DUF6973 domain-containing protein [bacterium]